MINGIVIFGMNGCGKSTVGKELAKEIDYLHMDIEDYYFIDSKIPYTKHRKKEECEALMLKDIEENGNFIITSTSGDFGDKIESLYRLGVYIHVPYDIRIERIRSRSLDKFNERVLLGGDMYELNIKFIEFCKSRKETKIESFYKNIDCPVIHIDGTINISENVKIIKGEIDKLK